jgi:entericidin A
MNMLKRTVLAIVVVIVSVCLSGCNTFKGFGSDVQWTGEQIENGAGNFTK